MGHRQRHLLFIRDSKTSKKEKKIVLLKLKQAWAYSGGGTKGAAAIPDFQKGGGVQKNSRTSRAVLVHIFAPPHQISEYDPPAKQEP